VTASSVGKARPGRPREFDEGEALDAAMKVFREHGYHATSVAELMSATGLAKASLYGAFGGKHSLFLAVLARYVEQRLALLATDLESSRSAREGLAAYLRRQAVEAAGGRGCLSANSALELLPGDQAVEVIVARHQRLTRDLIASALGRIGAPGGQWDGPRPDVAARYVFAIVEGMWEQGRTLTDPAPLLEVAEMTMRGLG
jgi:TetR/AcrR family transcriptional repressor of nem operon